MKTKSLMMVQLIQVTDGLKDEHVSDKPLLEKTYIPPQYGERLVSRIYDDGSLYYLSETETRDNGIKTDGKWNFITKISDKGIEKINNKLEKCRSFKSVIRNDRISLGEFVWKIKMDSGYKVLLVFGIPEGRYNVLNEIEDVINAG